MQNFRAKPRTAMRANPDASVLEHVAAVAVARLVCGPRMRIQVPPNLSDPAEFDLLVRAGADDWGGVSPLTADHVNPERPWPHLDELATRTADLGFTLSERLTAHPEYVLDAGEWIDPGLRAGVARLADPETGLAAGSGPTTPVRRPSVAANPNSGARADRTVRRLADAAAADPLALDDAQWELLLTAVGDDLEVVVAHRGRPAPLHRRRGGQPGDQPQPDLVRPAVRFDRRPDDVHPCRGQRDCRRCLGARRERDLRAGCASRHPRTQPVIWALPGQ